MSDLQVLPGGSRTEWERLIGDFDASAQARGLALRTVEHYSDVLRRVLLGYCERESVEPAALTKRHLERLSAGLLQAARSRQSVRRTCRPSTGSWPGATRRASWRDCAGRSPRLSAGCWTC